MRYLKANTSVKVVVGPFVDVTDGFTPETGITLGAADEAELVKHDAAAVTDISAATWAAITSMDGYYNLTLTTSHTDTEGMLVIAIQDDSVCLPVRQEFMVLSEAAYDSMFVAKDTGYMDVNIKAVSEDTTAADNLEAILDGTGAALTLKSSAQAPLHIESTGGNFDGMKILGNGTGHGLNTQGGATGNGIKATGGATSGNGMNIDAGTSGDGLVINGAGGNSNGISSTGVAFGNGMQLNGGVTGNGLKAYGGGTSGSAIYAEAQNGGGHGVELIGNASGDGLNAKGGASGDGIHALAPTAGHGIHAEGAGAGHGIDADGGFTSGNGISATGGGTGHGIYGGSGSGATGDGMNLQANSTDGRGLYALGNGTIGHGIQGHGAGTNATGIRGSAASDGDGISGTSAGTGVGILGSSAQGTGMQLTGSTSSGNNPGLSATGGGSGAGLQVTGGAGGLDIDAASIATASGEADAGSSTTTLVDAARTEADDYWNGQWLIMKTGANAGLARLITDFVAATDTITVNQAFPGAIAAGDDYEIKPAGDVEATISGGVNVTQWDGNAVTGDGDWAELQTDVDNILVDTAEIGAAGAGLTAVPWNASWDAEVESEVNDALVALHLDHLLAVDYDPAAKPGTATALLNELVENDAGVSRFTANALEQAPSGGTGLTALASGTAQAGTASTIQLAASETFADDELNGNVIKITSGLGAGQSRVIYDYTGATDTASITPNWATNPDSSSVYEVVEGSANITAWLNNVVTGDGDWAELQTDVDAILVDTGTTIPAQITALNDLSAAQVNTEVDNALADINLDHLMKVAVTGADVIDNSALAMLVSKSATADWDDFVNTTDSLQATADALAGLNDISPAEVNAEMVDVLKVDTIADLGVGLPPAAPTFEQAIMYRYSSLRNKIVQTDALQQFYNDAGTLIFKKTITPIAGQVTFEEAVTG